MEALTILLQRLSYPSRWCNLEAIFGRSKSELSLIFSKVFNLFYSTCLIKKLSGFSKYPPLGLTSVVSSTFSFKETRIIQHQGFITINIQIWSWEFLKPVFKRARNALFSSISSRTFSRLSAASSSYFCFTNSNSFFLCSNSSSLKLAFLSFFFSSISTAVSFDAFLDFDWLWFWGWRKEKLS